MLMLRNKMISIRTKISVATLFVLLLLTAFISVGFLSGFRSILKDTIFEQQFVLASQMAKEVHGRLHKAQTRLGMIAARINSRNISSRQQLQCLLDQKDDFKFFFESGLIIADAKGVVLAENTGLASLEGRSLAFREYIRDTLASRKPNISAPFKLAVAPFSPTLALTQPVFDDSGRIIAVVVGLHDLAADRLLANVESNDANSYQYLLYDRIVVEHSDHGRVLTMVNEGENEGIDRAVKGFEGSLDNYDSRGEHVLSSFKRVGDTRFIISANTRYDYAFRRMSALMVFAFAVVACGGILAVVGISIVAGRLTRPIKLLTDHVENSEAWSPVTIQTGDEVETLASAFNRQMACLLETLEEAFRLSERLMDEKAYVSGILNSVAAPMFVIDRQHAILFWNNAIERMTGLSAADMVGSCRQWQAFYDQERPVLADKVLDQDLEQLQSLYGNYRRSQYVADGWSSEGWYNFAGKRRYLVFDVAPVRNDKGEIIAAVETFEDVTERVLLEERLHKLLRAVEQSPASIVITDVQGTIEYVNPRFTQTTGYSAEEAAGLNPGVLESGEMPPEGYAELWRTITSGKEWRGELRNRRKDGSLYWEYVNISPLFDAAGNITHYLAVKEDITERKATEERLKHTFDEVSRAKREWETTLDCLRDVIILADERYRIRRCNRIFADMCGLDYREIIGSDFFAIIRDAGFIQMSSDGSRIEYHHNRGSRRMYDLFIHTIKDPETEAVQGTVISLNDTTELRQLTHELQKTLNELQQAQLQIFQQEKMASIGQLAAGVAHEINNPMGFISSNLGTLNKYMDRIADYVAGIEQPAEDGTPAGSAERQALRKQLKIDRIMGDAHQLIAESLEGAARVRRIVQDLKSFSRVDQAGTALINLNEALETTINIAWNEIKYVATLNREFGDIPEIVCFPQQLNQVFLNLLVNAAHAMEGRKHGEITVRTMVEGDFVSVVVADNGKGIAEGHLSRIFEPFFTTKEPGQGTGLGLSISYDIVKKHGGEIRVASTLGVGTTFTVCLPIAGPPAAAVPS